ncbi:MAG: hypothetical protein ABGW92_00380 [Methanocaldococcus sp.]
MKKEDERILLKLKKIRDMQRRKTLIGSFLVSSSIIMIEISVFIFIGVFNLNKIVGIILLFISLIFLSCGLYLLLSPSVIVVDDE